MSLKKRVKLIFTEEKINTIAQEIIFEQLFLYGEIGTGAIESRLSLAKDRLKCFIKNPTFSKRLLHDIWLQNTKKDSLDPRRVSYDLLETKYKQELEIYSIILQKATGGFISKILEKLFGKLMK